MKLETICIHDSTIMVSGLKEDTQALISILKKLPAVSAIKLASKKVAIHSRGRATATQYQITFKGSREELINSIDRKLYKYILEMRSLDKLELSIYDGLKKASPKKGKGLKKARNTRIELTYPDEAFDDDDDDVTSYIIDVLSTDGKGEQTAFLYRV